VQKARFQAPELSSALSFSAAKELLLRPPLLFQFGFLKFQYFLGRTADSQKSSNLNSRHFLRRVYSARVSSLPSQLPIEQFQMIRCSFYCLLGNRVRAKKFL